LKDWHYEPNGLQNHLYKVDFPGPVQTV